MGQEQLASSSTVTQLLRRCCFNFTLPREQPLLTDVAQIATKKQKSSHNDVSRVPMLASCLGALYDPLAPPLFSSISSFIVFLFLRMTCQQCHATTSSRFSLRFPLVYFYYGLCLKLPVNGPKFNRLQRNKYFGTSSFLQAFF